MKYRVVCSEDAHLYIRFNSTEGSLYPYKVGLSAFRGCTSLTSIVFPASVTSLDDSAFDGCVNLESVEAVGVVTLSDFVFLDCEKLETLKLNAKIVAISGDNFGGCNSLKTVETIGREEDYAVLAVENGCLYAVGLEGDYGLICALGGYKTVEIRDDITFIPKNAFRNSNIKEIVIPASAEAMASGAIMYCDNLKKSL